MADPYLSFDGMCWPNPAYAHDLCYRVAHAPETLTRGDQLTLSSFAQAYEMLVTMTTKERNKRVASIRSASTTTRKP